MNRTMHATWPLVCDEWEKLSNDAATQRNACHFNASACDCFGHVVRIGVGSAPVIRPCECVSVGVSVGVGVSE